MVKQAEVVDFISVDRLQNAAVLAQALQKEHVGTSVRLWLDPLGVSIGLTYKLTRKSLVMDWLALARANFDALGETLKSELEALIKKVDGR